MELDNYLTLIQNNCDELIDEHSEDILKHLKSKENQISVDFSKPQIDFIEPKSWGIYAFFIHPKKDISTYVELEELWIEKLNNKKLKSPNVIQQRFQKLEKDKTYCFYVGKSEKLHHRINQHIYLASNSSTYGLKLSEHHKINKNNTFAYAYFVLKSNPSENIGAIKFIIENLEKHVREELQPLVGKQ